MHPELAILVTLSISLTAALVLGYITQRLHLSPIVGYLLAGILIGPQTPGYAADQAMAAQLAEIGVILLMFGVGLHFHLRDLLAVRRVAVPGALGQLAVATAIGTLAVVAAGGGWETGIVTGIAVSVASTVVLIRVLTDNNVVQSPQGHIAVGWLIVQDLLTVLVLVLLPAAAAALHGHGSVGTVAIAFGLAVLKVALFAVLMLWGGRLVIPWILIQVARTRTRELFTLTTLVLALAVATGAAVVFDISVALGAFLAGTIVGQSEVSHQAGADALPMRDAFAVLFFVSVGMLFDPQAIMHAPWLFVSLLGVILVINPLTALSIVWTLGYSPRTALTIALGLAQIGEFSFILAALGVEEGIMTPEGRSLLVACAIVTISINPLIFRLIGPIESRVRRVPWLWRLLNSRAEARARRGTPPPVSVAAHDGNDETAEQGRAVIIGYGPVGRTAAGILKEFNIRPVIVDLNVDTIGNLSAAGELAVYGDAAREEILAAAGIAKAKYLLITIPELETRTVIIIVAREMNPDLRVFVRARYLEERAWLEEIGASDVCYEEAEAALGLATLLLREVGADDQRIQEEHRRIRTRLALDPARNEPAAAAVETAAQVAPTVPATDAAGSGNTGATAEAAID